MALVEQFQKAAEDVKNLSSTPSNDELLEIYSFYKQGTEGDCNTAKPGMLDFKGKSKWEAWNSIKGTSKDDAMNKYVEKVAALVEKYGSK
ncbi:hypothetical protein LSTR_LSTR012666 [Laodelphax striatellus]|uniref:ACB domain-containing protein n=1 Tax=Laodelphax striatellus TaxID=195883 RepID=A0A482X8M2_LAOST|nr:hypothetical protein LSTR_LSTR012666 [Laodelphax striatellus]